MESKLDHCLSRLAQDGYIILRGALKAHEVESTRQAVIELLDSEAEVARTTNTQTDNLRNAHSIVGKHPHFYEFYLNPPVMQIVRSVLGDDAMLYDGNLRVPMPTGERDAAKGFQVHVDREDYTVRRSPAAHTSPWRSTSSGAWWISPERTAAPGYGRSPTYRAKFRTPISIQRNPSG